MKKEALEILKQEKLIDKKGYNAQVNVVKVLDSGKKVVAGEDSLIKVVEKNVEIYLEKITNESGWLVNIEDVAEFENGDLVVVCTDGEVAIYIYNKNIDTYALGKIKTITCDDCFYFVNILDSKNIECWGEKNIKQKLSPYAF